MLCTVCEKQVYPPQIEQSIISHLPDGGYAYVAHLVIKAIIVVITVKAAVR